MTRTTKHAYEVTTAMGHKERIRAVRFDIADQIVVFDAKKGGKGAVAAFPVSQLDSVVRVDISSRAGRGSSGKKTNPKARSMKTTSTKVAPRHGRPSSSGKLAVKAKSNSKSRANAEHAR
jgi:hypothetical protein